MKLISSKATFFQKRVFPVVWFLFPALFAIGVLAGSIRDQHSPLPIILVPLGMGAFGYLLFRKIVFDLADEVFDLGDGLLVKRSGKAVKIPLSNVINVSSSTMQSPSRITLTLREPCEFGKEIAFMPPHRWSPFKPNPIAVELIERIDALRQRCH